MQVTHFKQPNFVDELSYIHTITIKVQRKHLAITFN